MRKRILKVYCSAEELKALAVAHEPVASCKGFQVISAAPKALATLRRRFLVEDITARY